MKTSKIKFMLKLHKWEKPTLARDIERLFKNNKL